MVGAGVAGGVDWARIAEAIRVVSMGLVDSVGPWILAGKVAARLGLLPDPPPAST
jgi:hypothetical protein